MGNIRKKYPSTFKAKIALEALREEKNSSSLWKLVKSENGEEFFWEDKCKIEGG